ncbi:peptidase M15 [Pseudomonas aeruginosa]|uniref:peptidase M15 n=1 Tax=Pseudomonas aeruginosa TaxID=287 RepID=UPI0021F1D757|nr:peptidase M15 [Pseudomonas aeruginosa]MCV6105119.1 peptidase M15 [Pseudomonas aeruginosa]MDI2202484.1 peptidase M15 [Pseudomonas aeruginosa]MDY1166140.1 peptidase M15 [Pseudomonas aeruginosa]
MRTIKSYDALDRFGRIRLSKNFFMRDFMYSEISNFYGIPNIPENPERAVEAGRRLCEELLEPLNATFGRIAVRSAYRSQKINEFGNEKGHNCASNKTNLAHHIWDYPDDSGMGATACIVIPWFMDKYNNGADWRSLAYWIHDHLPYSEIEFFDGQGMCSFNLSWHEKPKKIITSWMTPRVLLKGEHTTGSYAEWYKDFPILSTQL